jgi:hypothetical protein
VLLTNRIAVDMSIPYTSSPSQDSEFADMRELVLPPDQSEPIQNEIRNLHDARSRSTPSYPVVQLRPQAFREEENTRADAAPSRKGLAEQPTSRRGTDFHQYFVVRAGVGD